MDHLYLDLDGTIVDLPTGLCKHYNKPDPFQDPNNMGKMYGHYLIGLPELSWPNLPSLFWRNLQWMPDGVETLRRCEQVFGRDNITICTRAVGGESTKGKMEWLEINLPWYYANERHIITSLKERLAGPGQYLYDDSPKMVDKFTMAGGMGWLCGRPWNVFHRLDSLKRLDSLLDLYKQRKQT